MSVLIEKLEKKKKLLAYLNPASNQEIMTPSKLVEEVLDKLPEEVWNLENRFCDPAIKSGIFLLEVGIRLLKQFGEDKYKYIIDNCLYGFCVSKRAKILVESCFGAELKNVEVAGIEEIKKRIENMPKFDVVIGNPPYQDESRSGNALWALFINDAINMIRDDGVVSMIVPGRWVLPGNNGRLSQRIFNIFKKLNLLFIDKGRCSKYFKGVGTSSDYFSYFILKNNSEYKDTILQTPDDIFNIDLNNYEWLPYRNLNKKSLEICKKINEHKMSSFNFKWKNEKPIYDENGIYDVCMGGGKFKKTNKKTKLHNDKKIIMKLGRFIPYEKRLHIDYVGDVSINSAFVHLIDDDQNYDYLKSKLYRFLANCLSTESEITSACYAEFPKLDLNRVWTDAELYEYFELTEEEINYIEMNIPKYY